MYAGARYYDSAIARWLVVDPLASEFPGHSPYNYVTGNPIGLTDPAGMASADYYLNLVSGEVEHHDGSEDLSDQGLIRVAADDATVGDIIEGIEGQGFKFTGASESGKLQADTREAFVGWTMSQIFSAENVTAVLGIGALSGTVSKTTRSFGSAMRGYGLRRLPEIHPDKVPHIFRNKSGHFANDTPFSRAVVRGTAIDPYFLGIDSYGRANYARILSDGRQVWAYVRNGKITNAGVNSSHRTFNLKTGLDKVSR